MSVGRYRERKREEEEKKKEEEEVLWEEEDGGRGRRKTEEDDNAKRYLPEGKQKNVAIYIPNQNKPKQTKTSQYIYIINSSADRPTDLPTYLPLPQKKEKPNSSTSRKLST